MFLSLSFSLVLCTFRLSLSLYGLLALPFAFVSLQYSFLCTSFAYVLVLLIKIKSLQRFFARRERESPESRNRVWSSSSPSTTTQLLSAYYLRLSSRVKLPAVLSLYKFKCENSVYEEAEGSLPNSTSSPFLPSSLRRNQTALSCLRFSWISTRKINKLKSPISSTRKGIS